MTSKTETFSQVTVRASSTLGIWLGIRLLAHAKKKAAKMNRPITLRGEVIFSQDVRNNSMSPFVAEAAVESLRSDLNLRLLKKGLKIKEIEASILQFHGKYAVYGAKFTVE